VLAPGDGSRPVQFIDVRDLGKWIVDCLEDHVRGTYNATGPTEPLTFGRLLRTCRDVTGSDAAFTWVDDGFLVDKGVRPYVDLPLWIPGDDGLAFGTVQITRALEDGLQTRSLRETIADTWRWAAGRNAGHTWRAGIDAERESRLLRQWHELNAGS
jgi:2'-hydroxyisoflavone reductase